MTELMETIETYFWPLLQGMSGDGKGGLYLNIKLTLIAVPLSFVFGLIVGIARINKYIIVRYLAIVYIELSKSTPLILGIFWFYYFLPIIVGDEFTLFESSVVALVFFGCAYFAEAIHSGSNAINKEEIYSAKISGLSNVLILRYIILPQTLRIMFPAISSISIGLFKDTATVFVIGLVELTQSGMSIANRYPDKLISIYIIVAIFYLIICSLLSMISKFINTRIGMNKVDV